MIDFSFDAPLTKVTDEEIHEVTPPSQTADGEEYICGDSGPSFEGHTAGRDQDRSRMDELIPAQGCSRYVS